MVSHGPSSATPLDALIEDYVSRRLEGTRESIDELCARHPEHADALRRRLEALDAVGALPTAASARTLASVARGTGFEEIDDPSGASGPLPRLFDGFELGRELGRGGMGVVFEARQVTLDRRVAIKVLGSAATPSPRLRDRFDREIMTLARISHPGIVKVFGSGVVAGASYVAMELVDGESLVTRLPEAGEIVALEQIEECARVAVKLARALDYAHELGVIHRDVKPGNVLIDARGEPMLIDFGLARDDERDSVTTPGEFVGTLAYTAPEQARGERVDRRADVYGLGATLYHLVTGSPPYRARTITDLARQLEAGPPRSAIRLNPAVPRDLATVLEHATAPDPLQRYASCADFGADLSRVLEGVPIAAQPPSSWNLLTRLARKHRAVVGGVVAVVVALVIGLITTLWQAQRATREAENARSLSRLYRSLILAMDPDEYGRDVKLIDLLPDLVSTARANFAARPDILAEVLDTAGQSSLALGNVDQAQAFVSEALESRERLLGRHDPATLESLHNMAGVLQQRGDLKKAVELYREVWNASKDGASRGDRDALIYAHNFASALLDLGDSEEGLAVLRDTVEIEGRTLGEEASDTLTSWNTIARWMVEHGQVREGREILERIVAARRRLPPGHDVDSLAWLVNLADARRRSNDCPGAIDLLHEVVAKRLDELTERHYLTLSTMINLAAVLSICEHPAEAETWLTRAIPLIEQELGPGDPEAMRALYTLAVVLKKTDSLDRAEATLRDLLDRASRSDEDNTVFVRSAQCQLGQLLQADGRWEEAEELLLASWGPDGSADAGLIDAIKVQSDHWDEVGRTEDAARLRALLEQ